MSIIMFGVIHCILQVNIWTHLLGFVFFLWLLFDNCFRYQVYSSQERHKIEVTKNYDKYFRNQVISTRKRTGIEKMRQICRLFSKLCIKKPKNKTCHFLEYFTFIYLTDICLSENSEPLEGQDGPGGNLSSASFLPGVCLTRGKIGGKQYKRNR